MYCVNCGVKLADTEKTCPLCQTVVYHPDLKQGTGVPLYPEKDPDCGKGRSLWPQAIISMALLFPIVIVLLCDLEINRQMTWSGYAVGGILVAYEIGFLPLWFRNPNPVIFVPCGFAAVGLYLWFINQTTAGNWFWGFALPLLVGLCVIVTAVVALLRYVRRGKLYIFGGASLALGGLMFPMEILVNRTFAFTEYVGWAIYPLVTLALFGAYLIFLAICRPAREVMERKFFF